MDQTVGSQWLEAAARRLRAQRFPLGEQPEVRVQAEPYEDGQLVPGAYITPPTEGNGKFERYGPGTNERTHVGYTAQLTVVAGSLGGLREDASQQINWLQTARRLFHDQRLGLVASGELVAPGVSELTCKVEPGEWTAPRDDRDKADVSVVLITYWVFEPRGIEV